jgi:hypothetical protein
MAENEGVSEVPVLDFPCACSVERHLDVSFVRSLALVNYKKRGNSGGVMVVYKGH